MAEAGAEAAAEGGTGRQFGKLVPPFPVERCANCDCPNPVLSEQTEAFLFTDLVTGKLIVFCGVCAVTVELNRRDRWALIPL